MYDRTDLSMREWHNVGVKYYHLFCGGARQLEYGLARKVAVRNNVVYRFVEPLRMPKPLVFLYKLMIGRLHVGVAFKAAL